jgi:NAD(P)-dependent dehydrogenase (short-subunit alcohol dehydrogenase family)
MRCCLALQIHWRLHLNRKNKSALPGNSKPIKRLGEPEDVTGAVVFLTSDDAAFITGQAIVVDGGQYPIG